MGGLWRCKAAAIKVTHNDDKVVSSDDLSVLAIGTMGPTGRLIFHLPKISNMIRTKSQSLNDYRRVLQLSLPNPLKPGVKSRMKM